MQTRNIRRKTPVTLLAASIGLALYMPSSFAQEAATQDPAPQASAERAPLHHAPCGTPVQARWWCPTCDRIVGDEEDPQLDWV